MKTWQSPLGSNEIGCKIGWKIKRIEKTPKNGENHKSFVLHSYSIYYT